MHENWIMSMPDDVAMGTAVQESYLSLCDTYLRVKGVKLDFPPHLMPDVIRWRTMVMRHRSKDFRHKMSEKLSVQAVAEWTLEIKAELTGQPVATVDWQ
jgi:hypothetical protein